jgi:glutathione synthase/RimK-type ligase-like ATP-grasp enzyme
VRVVRSTRAIALAADKRRLAEFFTQANVPIPETHLFGSWDDVQRFRASRSEMLWCLKFPTACGASGHRMLTDDKPPTWWPTPFVVQEFVRMERPEVYRTYAVGGVTFGWMARRFPAHNEASPWVAHARGARYERAGEAPVAAVAVAKAALTATGLLNAFGCVDLLQKPTGEWVALEVGTDGLVNHVDRALDDVEMEAEILCRVAEGFWKWVGSPPPWAYSSRLRE